MGHRFTVRTNTRNRGGTSKQYTSKGQWYVVFEKDGALNTLLVPWDSRRSVRTILIEDYGVSMVDAIAEFLMK